MPQTNSSIQTAPERRDKFVDDFRINIASGIGVIFIRTLEPFRAEEALLDIAIDSMRQFYSWDMSSGWKTYNMDNLSDEPEEDKSTVQGVVALDKIKDFNDLSLMVMQWPHFLMKNLPPMIQKIAQLTRNLPTGKKRLALVIPPDYEIPLEIREMVMLMDFDVPDRNESLKILDNCLECVDESKKPEFNESEVQGILSAASGLTEIEAEGAYSRAMVTYRDKLPNITYDEFVQVVSDAKTDAVKRSDVLELMEAGSPDDIGGLENLKDWIKITAQCMTDEAVAAGVDKPKGVFLAGASGTGKSASAKAIAGELKLPLIKFDLSRVFSSLVGSSEARIKQALKLIESMSPNCVFLDEIDKVFNVNTGGGDSGVGSRILGTLLTFMQESDAGIFWILTANRVDGLPSELLRKGRLDETFAVTLPNADERLAILEIHLRKRNQDPQTVDDLHDAVEASEGYVGAELEAAVKESIKIAYVQGMAVSGQLIAEQLANMKPLSEAFKEQFEAMNRWADNNAPPRLGG